FINEQSVLQSIYSLEDQSIVIEENRVYPKKFYDYEEKAAVKLISLLNSKKKVFNNEVKLNNHIKEYQLKNKVILSEEQKQAIKAVLNNKVMILTGNAGTGKTTVLKAIIHIYQQVYPKDKISLSAPTGRASRRMKEVTQHEATTNHRLLGYNQGLTNIEFEYNSSNQLKYDFLIIDEMSMVDLHLFHALLQAINPHARVLFTGDADQLPSINPGNVLLDLIKSKLPCIRLREVFRQAKESQIITNANRVNKGKSIEIDQTKDDMYFIQRANDMSIANTLIKSAVRFIEKGYSISDLLILTPMKNGEIGTYRMNSRLQDILNPYSINKNEVKQGNKIFREGDKVIQTINRPEDGVFNGDIGIITHIGSNTKGDNGNREIDIISCDYQGIQVTYKKDEWREIELGYSITIHKSQGGQAPIVLIPMSMAHYNMLIRNLIYTGMTRAEEKLIFIGDMNALNKGINTNRIIERRTTLANKIQKNIEKLTEFHKKRSKNIENVL
ncbi:AAA family ATPase, partial [Bacillus sp. CRN 9]|nr:AAA family ATPase [Bacillus sp. CRN 9]